MVKTITNDWFNVYGFLSGHVVVSFDAREWILQPIDRGYMEKDGSGGLKNILVDNEPASDPVPLNNGVAAPGTKPNILTFYIYPTADFSWWGNPG